MFKKNVLVVSGILPISTIEHKKGENDILLVTEDEITSRFEDISFRYIFIFPYVNKLISKLSAKWNSYYNLAGNESYELNGRMIFLFPVFLLPKRLFFRNILTKYSLWQERKRLDRLIKDFQPTIIHAQDSDTSAYIARFLSKKYNVPYIVTVRGLNNISDNNVKLNLKHADCLIALSVKQKNDCLNLVKKEVHLIPHGVHNMFYIKTGGEKSYQTMRIICVARLIKLKNIDLVINSLKKIKGNYIFHIYGVGPEMESLRSLIKSLDLEDRIELKGFIDNKDLPKKLVEYNLFIMPSFPETLGRVYFEAMASGLPVIASKNTGIDGIISHGEEGFLVNHESEVELVHLLSNIMDNTIVLKEMSQYAYRKAENFNWDEVSKKYYNLYTSLSSS